MPRRRGSFVESIDLSLLIKSSVLILEVQYKWVKIKNQKLNYGIPLDLRKRSSKIGGNFVSGQQLNII